MRLLILEGHSLTNPSANGLDFAIRAARDGHDVRWYVPDNKKLEHIGHGLANIVRDFTPSLKSSDLIFLTDNTTYLRNIDAIRAQGAPVIGATSESANWELDRCKGMQVFEDAGIEVPEYREFNSYDDAIRYVKKEDRAFVSKPSGDADKALSYVSDGPADLVCMLERWKANQKLKGGFILQEKVEGIEMAVGGWIGPAGFCQGWCENFEFKKLCTGNLGPTTGEQGTVLRYVRHSKLARKVLQPLEELLVDCGHTGYIDVNCIVDDSGRPWPLEFTCRPGWPTFQIQQELHQGDCAEWLAMLANGEDANCFDYNHVAVGVVIAIPNYPFSSALGKDVIGYPIYIDASDDDPHFHFCEVALRGGLPDPKTCEPSAQFCTAGDYVLVVSGAGDNVRDAKSAAYDSVGKVKIPNSPFYRTDIGDRLRKELPQLQKHGYCLGLEWAPRTKPKEQKRAPEMIGGVPVLYV
jgi:phosphoribosylamine--glycine ligase